MTSGERFTRRNLFRLAGLGAGAAAFRSLPASARTLSGTAGEPMRIARVVPSTPSHLFALAGFDDTHMTFDDGSLELLLWPGDLARLEATGMRYEITVADVVARDRANLEASPAPIATGVPGARSDYRHLDDYEADLRLLADTYPDQVRLFTLPLRSLEGRTVYGIEVAADVHVLDGRPVFYMDGLHHAREWPSGELTIMFAHDLVEHFGSDPRITALMHSVRTVAVPVVNPDGFSYSRDSLVQTRTAAWPVLAVAGMEAYWRKNRRSLSGVTVPVAQRNPDAYGVDANRNYGMHWGGPGADANPLSQVHRGDAPYSEPEVENVRRLLSSMHVTALNSNHTYGDLILRPLGWTASDAPDEGLLRDIGDAMAATMHPRRRYRSQKSVQLYPTTGTTMDWGYGMFGALSYTFEHGSVFHPPYSQIPDMYELNREAFLLLAEAAADPAHHSVITGRVTNVHGQPLVVSVDVDKSFDLPLWSSTSHPETISTSMQTDPDGHFTFHVCPSRRPFESGSATPYDVILGAAGHAPHTTPVTVARGSTADLGTVTLT